MKSNVLFEESVRETVETSSFLLTQAKMPLQSIVPRAGGDEHLQPNTSIVDPTTRKKLAFIERSGNEDELPKLATAYHALLKRQQLSIPVYLFMPSTSSDYSQFRIFALSEGPAWEPIKKEDFPTFEALSALQSASEESETKVSQKDAVDKLRSRCEWLGAFLLIIFVASLLIDLSYQSLIVLGAACAVVILPYYKKVAIRGFELERLERLEDQVKEKIRTRRKNLSL